ncbi:hypothetical protein V493_02249 [Pseudogymnoascus sp. VKM F-4281 (FW-2241)]|nr:hypothetical protein V493_02249 [Pseudogymnoascus sp. VKM F-4281 (FW-2241)]
MPSITSLLSYAAITLLATSQLCAATPVPIVQIRTRDSPRLPSTGTGPQLPAPGTNRILKFVTLGRGVQNYTCAGDCASPVAVGAIAEIFDITAFARASPASPKFIGLPGAATYLTLPDVQKLLNTCMPSGSHAAVIGKHYFNSAGVPTFDLSVKGKKLLSKLVSKVDAPSGANAGPAGTGAVPWLKLDDAGGSAGLKEVYRVFTAGGKPPSSCSGKKAGKVFTVEYAAMYWFYG